MKYEDSFNLRVCNLDTHTIIIHVENTIPLMITDDTKIQDYVLKSVSVKTQPQATAVKLKDESFGSDRFVFITSIVSPLTENNAYLYYDKKYKDILITPPLSFFNLGLANMTYEIRGTRLGSGEDLSGFSWNLNVPTSDNSRFFLPETKANVGGIKVHLMGLPGIGTNSNNTRDDSYEEMIDNNVNLKHNIRRLGTLVELGTPANVFNNPDKFPLYLLYQSSLMEYGIKYLSNISRPNNKLYFRLKF